MNDLTVVVPLGISSPGTPVIRFLEASIESLQKQQTNYKYEIIFACDDNVSVEVKNLLTSTGCTISWYEPYSFFRKGSIWRKITNEWNKVDSKYVSFCHYDDLWATDRVETQLTFMNSEKLDLTWTGVVVIDENNKILGNPPCPEFLSRNTIIQGPAYAFSHSSIVSKHSFFNCGIMEHLDNNAPQYEYLFWLYSHKLKGKKNSNYDFRFIMREHSSSMTQWYNKITNTNQLPENNEISELREIGEYSFEQIKKDYNSVDVSSIIKSIYGE